MTRLALMTLSIALGMLCILQSYVYCVADYPEWGVYLAVLASLFGYVAERMSR